MAFTSGGGIGGNKSPMKDPPPWLGCLSWLVLIGVIALIIVMA